MSKGRNTTVVSVRLSDELLAQVKELTIGKYYHRRMGYTEVIREYIQQGVWTDMSDRRREVHKRIFVELQRIIGETLSEE